MVNASLIKIYLLCIVFVLGLTAIGLGAIVGLFPALGDAVASLADTTSEVIEVTSVAILGFMKFREGTGGKPSSKNSTMILICAYIVMSFLQVSSNVIGLIPGIGDVGAPLIKVILQLGQFVDAVLLAF
ncbi:MAG: hypothetical protein HY513_03275 [Candidatus Aenigmarchaeota archaeon]|nr:hypothetical protein [Candidatus Aenigmarchaeota archaeon]